jgi:LuxR family maltose regulon positive regulatory protein
MPELPDWAVTRPRIDKLIADGARGPLTSVTGPPGAGKTMAVAAWAASTSYPCTLAWISIDDYDNRPRVFWSYVVAALRRAGVAVPRVVPGPGRVTVDHAFLVRLAAILAVQDPPVVLVLDDLHLLTEPVILEGLAYVLRNAGPGLHLMVVSRADPLLPLHRYRLAGQLAEIRAGDLAFSVREGGLLLAHHGVTLSVPALERVTARTEGWAAGMRLAALSLQGHSDPEQFAKELETGDSALTSYLIDEVLNVQAPAVRDMLLRTSILDNVSTDLAAELTGDRAGADALPALARADASGRGGIAITRCSRRYCVSSCGSNAARRYLTCTGARHGGASATDGSATPCDMPRNPATGRSPPGSWWTSSPSASSSNCAAITRWPRRSAACRGTRRGRNRSRCW